MFSESHPGAYLSVLQEDRLLISDPKALQYIFHTSGEFHLCLVEACTTSLPLYSGYGFRKWPERTEISRVLMGRGLLWADGTLNLSFCGGAFCVD
jgi:hypothetical protein